MKASITVRVTDQDIARGVQAHSGKCMIAEALKRAYPEADKVMVDIQTIRFTDSETDERLLWLTPFNIQDLIVAFDAGELSRLEPVGFRLLRRSAQEVQRQLPATPEDREARNAAMREGKPTAGTHTVKAVPAAGGGVVPKDKKARRSSTKRSYGRRALTVNQARARQGDLPPEPEPIPE